MQKKYDSTVARIAGNLLSSMTTNYIENLADPNTDIYAARWAVSMARRIVKEVERTEPVNEKS